MGLAGDRLVGVQEIRRVATPVTCTLGGHGSTVLVLLRLFEVVANNVSLALAGRHGPGPAEAVAGDRLVGVQEIRRVATPVTCTLGGHGSTVLVLLRLFEVVANNVSLAIAGRHGPGPA